MRKLANEEMREWGNKRMRKLANGILATSLHQRRLTLPKVRAAQAAVARQARKN